jgi:hypothetical protein
MRGTILLSVVLSSGLYLPYSFSQSTLAAPSAAQSAPESQHPGDLYKQAMRPLNQVRTSLDNWSDAEVAALATGMKIAKQACEQSDPKKFTGDDLFDLARLCALGQSWLGSFAAAQQYINSESKEFRTKAYVLKMNALVQMKARDAAVETAETMLAKLPYDAEIAYALLFLKSDLEQSFDPAALKIATQEQSALLAALGSGTSLKAAHSDAVMSLGELYASGMQRAFLESEADNAKEAAKTVAELNAALANVHSLNAFDREQIDAAQTRISALGKPLPSIQVLKALRSADSKALMPTDFGSATVFLLTPDWCAQCKKMSGEIMGYAIGHSQENIHGYALVYHDNRMAPAAPDPSGSPDIWKDFQGMPALVVPPQTAQSFGATDFPFAIVTNSTGEVQFAGPIPAGAFTEGGFIEAVIHRIAPDASKAP